MRRAVLLALAVALAAPGVTDARPKKKHRTAHVSRRDERVVAIAPRPTPAPTPTPPPPKPGPKPLARVQVVAREFSLTLSRMTLPAGPVAVELDNFGQDPHDLRIERADNPAGAFTFTLAKPGTRASQKLDLGAGTWKLYCTLPGHEALGMRALVTITG